jgi:hypothetical protein
VHLLPDYIIEFQLLLIFHCSLLVPKSMELSKEEFFLSQ